MKVFVKYNALEIETEITTEEVSDLVATLVASASSITPRQVVLGKAFQTALMQKSEAVQTPDVTNGNNTSEAQ